MVHASKLHAEISVGSHRKQLQSGWRGAIALQTPLLEGRQENV